MRKRFQKGSLQNVNGAWVARWWEEGQRRARTLGRVSKMTKTQAQSELAVILFPINNRPEAPTGRCKFEDFVEQIYFPFYRRKWKRSSATTNWDRVRYHLVSALGERSLKDIRRDELQAILDQKARTLAFSVVNHLRWDLRQIFQMAFLEGHLERSPAELLFTPRECRRPERRVMSFDEVRLMLSVLDVRANLVAKLAVLAGMRPGEIFALQWRQLEQEYVNIEQRIYRGEIDTPKTTRSRRRAALSDSLLEAIQQWKAVAYRGDPDGWVFASERLVTPISRDNCWRRDFSPNLEKVGLTWANFQVMRRTHSSLLKDLDVDPHIRAEQMGHSVDVNENVYTMASMTRRRAAVNRLDEALKVM